ncbi:Glycosyl hydrolases family 43 [Rhizoctonia solani]|uniref:Endo-1,5-alpha-L-arabinanase A n=1 Tax=Rhizoctonia solani TaxID=456999 RepID=A0A8H7IFP5_9AGAM|nr:Glycosyl hydrolases family 43 [Rhizoctonia solani]
MKFSFSTVALSALSLVSGVLALVTGSLDVHDPTMCRDSAGKWFLFSTGVGIPIRTSTDRLTGPGRSVWSPGQATWITPYTGGTDKDIWAPDCTYKNGQFYLYYATSTFGSRNSAIFFAKSSTGLPGSWSHQGQVLATSTSNDYNAIDPNLIIGDGNNWWLTFGSYWSGIKLPSTGKPSSSTVYSIAKRTAGGGAVEAPILVKNGNYYYLFTSWDKCCSGTSSPTMFALGALLGWANAKLDYVFVFILTSPYSITGPYVDQAGVALTSGGG